MDARNPLRAAAKCKARCLHDEAKCPVFYSVARCNPGHYLALIFNVPWWEHLWFHVLAARWVRIRLSSAAFDGAVVML